VASGVDKLTINGLAFTGAAWIDGDGAITGVTFKNNYVYNTLKQHQHGPHQELMPKVS
jgi:hypothetical protein